MDKNTSESTGPMGEGRVPPPVSFDTAQLPFRYGLGDSRVFEVKGLEVTLLTPIKKWIKCPGELFLCADGKLRLTLTISNVWDFKPKHPMFESFDVLQGVGVPARADNGREFRISVQRLIEFEFSPDRAICTYDARIAFASPNAASTGSGKLIVPLLNFHAFLGEPVSYPSGSSALGTLEVALGNRKCQLFIDPEFHGGPGKETSFCLGHLEYEVSQFQEARERDFVSRLSLLLSLATGRWVEPGAIILDGSENCVLMGSLPGSGRTKYFPIGGIGNWGDLKSFIEQTWNHIPVGQGLPPQVLVRYLCYLLTIEVWEIQILVTSALLESLKFHYAAVLAINEGKVKSISEFSGRIVLSDKEIKRPPFELLYEPCHLWNPKSGTVYPSLAQALNIEADTLKLRLFKKVYRNPVVHTGTVPEFQDEEYHVAEYGVDFAVRALLRWVGYKGRYNQYGTWADGYC